MHVGTEAGAPDGPVLEIHGKGPSQAATECIPGAQAAVIANAGHMAILEDPRAIATLISGFIAQHERR